MLELLSVLPFVLTACPEVAGAAPALKPGRVVLLGEIHGTREAPEAVASLACLALEDSVGVTVALEIPASEQGRLDVYLDGGSEADLLEGEFWQREYQDGRSSQAMLGLLSTLRSYRGSGRLRVVAIDDPRAPRGRDDAMARRLEALSSEAAQDLLLALTGNVHNRLTRGVRWDSDYEPMGYRLRALRPDVEIASLELTHAGGAAWVCTGGSPEDCGVRELRGEAASVGITLFEDPAGGPFTGQFQIGRISASPPAKEPCRQRLSPPDLELASIETPSDYCASEDIEVEMSEGWVMWWSDDKGPWVWYYTRGC